MFYSKEARILYEVTKSTGLSPREASKFGNEGWERPTPTWWGQRVKSPGELSKDSLKKRKLIQFERTSMKGAVADGIWRPTELGIFYVGDTKNEALSMARIMKCDRGHEHYIGMKSTAGHRLQSFLKKASNKEIASTLMERVVMYRWLHFGGEIEFNKVFLEWEPNDGEDINSYVIPHAMVWWDRQLME